MQESHSSSKYAQLNSDSQESQISGIPQLRKPGDSFSEDKPRPSGQYIKVSKKNQIIDEEAILEEFKKKQQDDSKGSRNIQRIVKKKKIEKAPAIPSKKYDFGNIKKKWKAEIDQNIEKYKQYLKQQKKAYEGKYKQLLLDFYKILLEGVFELKDASETTPNDLTGNQKKIIAPESDVYLYLKGLVESFDQTFRQAKVNGKILNEKTKWDPMIKNCKDQTNFQTRRKIIRSKIKPIHVMQNGDQYLMSEEAKLKEQRRKKLILAQADKDFKKPLDESEDQQFSIEQHPVHELPQPIESLRSMNSNDVMQKRISQQREKLEQFKQFIGDEPAIRMKKRINELLAGTSSYDRIMRDFTMKFENI